MNKNTRVYVMLAILAMQFALLAVMTVNLNDDKSEGEVAVSVVVGGEWYNVSGVWTVLEATENASAVYGFQMTVEYSAWGAYVSCLDNQSASANAGWVYTVNGEVAMTGAGDYALEDGDVIAWEYTSW